MIDNNLDFDVALYPYELVTYGETGQVFQVPLVFVLFFFFFLQQIRIRVDCLLAKEIDIFLKKGLYDF